MPSQSHWTVRSVRAFFGSKSASRGDTAVEYVILIGTIAVPAIPAFVAVVRQVVSNLNQMQAMLLMPFP